MLGLQRGDAVATVVEDTDHRSMRKMVGYPVPELLLHKLIAFFVLVDDFEWIRLNWV